MHYRITAPLLFLTLSLLTQCNTLEADLAALAERESAIATEPKGDYFIGRRYVVATTRFWGYVRKPGQSWRDAQLVMMDESKCYTPDRYKEFPKTVPGYTYDNNYEYRIYGKFTGKPAYDPNTNLKLPIFQPTRFQLVSTTPGFLFIPSEHKTDAAVTLRPFIMPPLNPPTQPTPHQ